MIQTDPDGYSTHQVPLISAVHQTLGSVIELGMGHYSTPLLHELCAIRFLLSVDCSLEYAEQFKYLRTSKHWLMKIKYGEWDKVWPEWERQSATWYFESVISTKLSVVFIDHADQPNRVENVKFFADKAEFIVVHDSNVRDENGVSSYGYDGVFETFKYRYEYCPNVLHTTVLSNFREFKLCAPIGNKVR